MLDLNLIKTIGKGSKERIVPINDIAIHYLKIYVKDYRYKLVKKYSSVVTPLKTITPHKLRSTYGTNLYHETQDIYVVADVLGHKDINTTKRHYAAMSDDVRRTAANKVKLRED